MPLNFIRRLFKKRAPTSTSDLGPEEIESLPSADDATFYRDSKKLLQRFDEYITAAEVESETLSIELDDTLEQESLLVGTLQRLSKPGSWHEQHLLLKLDRLKTHGDNLKKRIQIYSQNIRVYLNLISKIEDMKAMRMNGLDEDKIENIWLEFKETFEEYKRRISSEDVAIEDESVLTHDQERRISELRASLLDINPRERQHPVIETEPDEKEPLVE